VSLIDHNLVRVRLHAFLPASRANGPGLRAVLWFQGCTLGCPGCFNPGTHDPAAGREESAVSVANAILGRQEEIDGVSISGGEPFQQPEALLDLLRRIEAGGLSRLAFSGYTLREIERQPLGPAILRHLDVLIAGPYLRGLPAGAGLLASANQQIHLLTSRHCIAEFENPPRAEIVLHADGTTTVTGIAPPDHHALRAVADLA